MYFSSDLGTSRRRFWKSPFSSVFGPVGRGCVGLMKLVGRWVGSHLEELAMGAVIVGAFSVAGYLIYWIAMTTYATPEFEVSEIYLIKDSSYYVKVVNVNSASVDWYPEDAVEEVFVVDGESGEFKCLTSINSNHRAKRSAIHGAQTSYQESELEKYRLEIEKAMEGKK